MKVYVVTKISTGEDRLALDEVEVYSNPDDAKKALDHFHDEIINDVEGYEITVDELTDSYFIVEIDDDYATYYYGRIKVREVN